MGKVLVTKSYIQGAANAIRQKTGGSEVLRFTPAELEQGILDIPQGIFPVGTKTVLNNGSNIDVETYKYVDVNVQPPLEDKEITVSAGDEITVEPSSGKYGLSSVTVNVNDVTLKDITITADGDYDVPAGFDGYGTITVDTGVEPTVGTKTVTQAYGTTETYIATDDDIDGYSQITVTTTAPTGDITINSNGTYDVKDKAKAIVSLQTQSKSVDVPYGTQVTVSPDTNKLLSSVVVNATEPEGNKAITNNGNNIDVKDYATVSVNVPNSTETLTATENYHTYTPSTGNIGFSSVTVNVTPELQNLDVSSNGTYIAEDGYDGLGRVNVNVPLGTKTINSNGTYSASADDLAGYSSVNVAVQSGMSHASTTTANNWNVSSLTFTFPEGDTDDPNIAWMLVGGTHATVPSTNNNYYIERLFKYIQNADIVSNKWFVREDIPGMSGGTSDTTVTIPNEMWLNITKNNNQITIDFNSTLTGQPTNRFFYPNCTYTLYKVSNQ